MEGLLVKVQDALMTMASFVNNYLSNYMLVILLVGCGLYFSIRTKFVQVRCFGEAWRSVFGNISLKGKKHDSGMSSFQALTTAIAAQVGTGNIVGACGAILIGGPGAIFWMWIIAFFGMATIYAEAVLAQETRVKNPDGSISGGPVYYIKRAFKGKFGTFLAGFFAVALILALGFMGTMVQSNSIAGACKEAFNIPTWIVGLIIAVLAAAVFLGGTKRLAAVTEKLVPVMAVLYILGSLVILACRIEYIPATFALIVKAAFDPTAIIGGSLGAAIYAAISQGAKRGLFSNEAGMGSTPHAHAQANVKTPHDQGVVAMMGVFIDTFIVLTLTALVVISTMYVGDGALAGKVTDTESLTALSISNNNLAQLAFGSVFGKNLGSIFVAVCLLFFAFSTILGWNFFGRINVQYLFGKKAVTAYSVLAVIFVVLGALFKNDLVWELTDMFNNIMVLPNVIALLALSGLVAASAKKAGKNKESLSDK